MTKVPKKKQKISKLFEAVRDAVEWEGGFCVVCNHARSVGHVEGCKLVAVLALPEVMAAQKVKDDDNAELISEVFDKIEYGPGRAHTCPDCGAYPGDGHKGGCNLSKFLFALG